MGWLVSQGAWGIMLFLLQFEYEWEILDFHNDLNEVMNKK